MKNNTIALLVGMFIVVLIGCILVGPEKVSRITGSSVSSSTTSFNISEEVSVLVTGAVNFGAGRVYANASQAILDSSLGYSYLWKDVNTTTNFSTLSTSLSMNNVVYHELWDVFIVYNDRQTFQFNYSDKRWTNITKNSSNRPTVVSEFAMVYDSSINEIILFGGRDSEPRNETWKFNSNGDWVNLNPSVAPPKRDLFPGMVFDRKRNVIVLFGGMNSPTAYNDTWEYNASSNTWTNKTKNPLPPSRYRFSMAFDSYRNVTVIFGGQTPASFQDNETWEYNGTDWVNVTAGITNAPGGRRLNGMTYDPARKKIIVGGGYSTDYFNDVWEYNGLEWAHRSDFYIPRIVPNLVFNPTINKTFLFGGANESLLFIPTIQEYSAVDFNGTINGTWNFQQGFINVENDGTVNVSVNYSANKDAGQFIGGTNPSFMLKGVVDEANACPALNTTYAEISNSTLKSICPLFQYAQDIDIFKVPIKLVIPANAPAGTRNSTITFTATQIN